MNSATLTAAEADSGVAATTPRPHQHMPSLDGLRGTAILLVIAHHLFASLYDEFAVNNSLLHWTELGWAGVDLFFVLSGFLITGILYDAKGTPCYFKNFYARRSLRIFPLYYIALAVVLVMTPLLSRLHLLGTANPAWLSIYATNFVISAKGVGSFGVLDHFWSLAVEEHFYLIWPAVVFALNRKAIMIVAACLCVIAPCLRLSLFNGAPTLPDAAYMLTPMRMDSLAAGAFIALLVRGPRGMKGLVAPAAVIGTLALVAFVALVLLRHSKDSRDAALASIGFTLLWAFFGSTLLLALNWKPLQSLMSLPVLRWFGKYSYGLYVWHPIIFIFVFHTEPARQFRGGDGHEPMLASIAVALVTTFVLTLASWHLWEKQFLKWKTRFA
jgi:peptidoglycan/LPS O-acetylase OafA/YrhL